MRYIVCILIVLAAFAGFGVRLIDWQLVHGEEYRNLATGPTPRPSGGRPRGEILDVNGVDLAINITGYRIVFDKAYLQSDTQNDIILTLAKLLERRGGGMDRYSPIDYTGGEYAYRAESERAVATLQEFLRLQSYATAQNCMDSLVERYDCGDYDPADARIIASVR